MLNRKLQHEILVKFRDVYPEVVELGQFLDVKDLIKPIYFILLNII